MSNQQLGMSHMDKIGNLREDTIPHPAFGTWAAVSMQYLALFAQLWSIHWTSNNSESSGGSCMEEIVLRLQFPCIPT